MTNNENDDWTTFSFGWEEKRGEQKGKELTAKDEIDLRKERP